MPIGQKVDTEELRKRRLAARKLLDEGIPQAEVARRLNVSRQSVSRWAETPKKQLGAVCRFGRRSSIDDALLEKLRITSTRDRSRLNTEHRAQRKCSLSKPALRHRHKPIRRE